MLAMLRARDRLVQARAKLINCVRASWNHHYGTRRWAFRRWVARASAGDPAELQIMYGVNGERRLTEVDLDWLPGYEGSRPVRLGNDASRQFQLDVYGEVDSAIYRARELGLAMDLPGQDERMLRLMDFLEKTWSRPDDGIGAVRGGRRHFTHSKLMAWVAMDRAIRAQERWRFGGARGDERLPHWRATRARIREDITWSATAACGRPPSTIDR